MTLDELNSLGDEEAAATLAQCCTAKSWATRMSELRPFPDPSALFSAAETCFERLEAPEWLAAFAAHPRIGELEQLDGRSQAAEWSRSEQSGVEGAGRETLAELAESNRRYEQKFDFVFLICASGMAAEELLSELKRRSHNSPDTETQLARIELRRITRLRLEKLIVS